MCRAKSPSCRPPPDILPNALYRIRTCSPGTKLHTIADFSTVWGYADVIQMDMVTDERGCQGTL